MPEGLNYVPPTVQSGWTINTVETGQTDDAAQPFSETNAVDELMANGVAVTEDRSGNT